MIRHLLSQWFYPILHPLLPALSPGCHFSSSNMASLFPHVFAQLSPSHQTSLKANVISSMAFTNHSHMMHSPQLLSLYHICVCVYVCVCICMVVFNLLLPISLIQCKFWENRDFICLKYCYLPALNIIEWNKNLFFHQYG